MDFGLALTYQFKDQDWPQKILLASLVSLIPVFGWFVVFGWSLEITRRVILDDPQPLPRLDFINDFVRGLKGLVLNVVYSLPALVVVIPVGLLIGLASVGAESRWFLGVNLVGALCLTGAAIVYGVVLMFVLPAAYGQLVAEGESLEAALSVKSIFKKVRAAPAAYLLVAVGQILSAFIASFGAAACVIGVIVTTTYTFSIMGHLYGQAHKETRANETKIPVGN